MALTKPLCAQMFTPGSAKIFLNPKISQVSISYKPWRRMIQWTCLSQGRLATLKMPGSSTRNSQAQTTLIGIWKLRKSIWKQLRPRNLWTIGMLRVSGSSMRNTSSKNVCYSKSCRTPSVKKVPWAKKRTLRKRQAQWKWVSSNLKVSLNMTILQ